MKQIISFEKEIPFKTMVGEITAISLEHTLAFQDDSSIGGDFIVSGTYKLTEASRLDEPFSYKVPVDIVLTKSLEEDTRSVEIENFTYEILDEEALLVKIDVAVEGVEIEDTEESPVEEVEDVLNEDEVEQEDTLCDFEEEVQDTDSSSTRSQEDTIEKKEQEEAVSKEVQEEEVEVLTVAQEEVREEVLETKQEEKSLTENTVLSAQENIDKVSEQTQEALAQEQGEDAKEEASQEVMHSIFSVFKDAEETFSTYSVYILREEDTLDEVLNRYHVSREEASLYNNLEELHVGSKLILPTVITNE